ncbi:MAG: indolepyruvate oxidoreductase subunit beta [Bacteroidales bacterium]|jgi:indolepyruvate ferredoxin oxidoreductase beta subunit|nr:indolepyruvate oxidoreductase subunit beta [Bacteroidales bacterium]MCK9497875.1 indolepyruvate oxidoreductase subunit beta [Bacteroidales bacterium]MDY0314524.1 indolepyruvate oxidoreductase subunit beta [Bacteroidales bacterium]
MKKDIILAGVGGQGILTIAAIIGSSAINKNLYLKQAEVHGMSQRGGDVQSNLRISDKPIYSDLITKGHADMIISVEPMESLRYLPFLKKDGYLITNTVPFKNIPNYPEDEEIYAAIDKLPNKIALDAEQIAKDLGNVRSSNVVVLGAATPFLGFAIEELEGGIKSLFGKKGDELVEMNIKALHAGYEFAKEKIK